MLARCFFEGRLMLLWMLLACGPCRLVQLPELITRRPISLRVSVHYKPHSSCLRCTTARGGNPYSPPALCFRLSPRASDLDGVPRVGLKSALPVTGTGWGGRGFRFFCVTQSGRRGGAKCLCVICVSRFVFSQKIQKNLVLWPKSRQTSPGPPEQSPAKFPDARPPRPAPAPDSPRLSPTLPDSPRLSPTLPDSPRLSPTLRPLPPF